MTASGKVSACNKFTREATNCTKKIALCFCDTHQLTVNMTVFSCVKSRCQLLK